MLLLSLFLIFFLIVHAHFGGDVSLLSKGQKRSTTDFQQMSKNRSQEYGGGFSNSQDLDKHHLLLLEREGAVE